MLWKISKNRRKKKSEIKKKSSSLKFDLKFEITLFLNVSSTRVGRVADLDMFIFKKMSKKNVDWLDLKNEETVPIL